MDLVGDSLWFYGTAFSYIEMRDIVTYGIVNTQTRQLVSTNFITDGTDALIKKPYGIKVNPVTREIYVTDAKNYVTPGTLYCFSPQGHCLWSVRTGDIPAHLTFLPRSEE